MQNMDWLEEELGGFDDDYLIIDCPGIVFSCHLQFTVLINLKVKLSFTRTILFYHCLCGI